MLAGKRRMAIVVAVLTATAALLAAPAARSADRGYLVMYKGSTSGSVSAETGTRERRLGFTPGHLYRHAVRGFSARLSPGQVAALRADPEVAIVSPDRRVHALATVPKAPGDSIPPGVARIGAASGDTVREASGAAVAIIDSGIQLTQPELNAESGVNCVANETNDDLNGHGTHVAGVVAARNNGAEVAGVTPGTRVVAVKVLGANGLGFVEDVVCGIDWLAANAAARGVRVANMSLGFSDSVPTDCGNEVLHAAVCRLAQAGVVPVVAAGNDGHNFGGLSPDVPASYPEVLTVTGMGDGDGAPGGAAGALQCPTSPTIEQDDALYSQSSFAVAPEDAAHAVAAPAACIESTLPDGSTERFSGTSAAAPHVSGTVALCFDEGGRGGPCGGLSTAAVVRKIVDDAARGATPANGFVGDPNQPLPFRIYGHLVSTVESTRPLPPPPPPPPAAPAPTVKPKNRVALRTRTVRLRRGFAVVRMHCRGPARCRGKLKLTTLRRGKRRPVLLGRKRFSIAAGKTRSVRVRIPTRKRRLVRRAKRVRATIALEGGDPLARTLAVRHPRR